MKRNIEKMRRDLDGAVAEVAKKHGVNIVIGKGRVRKDKSISFKAVARTGDATPNRPKIEVDFELFAPQFGLNPKDLHKKIRGVHDEKLEIVGLRKRSRKNPILVKTEKGEVQKMPADLVKRLMH